MYSPGVATTPATGTSGVSIPSAREREREGADPDVESCSRLCSIPLRPSDEPRPPPGPLMAPNRHPLTQQQLSAKVVGEVSSIPRRPPLQSANSLNDL